MIVLVTILISISLKSISEYPVILDGSSDIYTSEFLFFTTQQGIYVFDRNTVTWGRITTANGLPGNEPKVIGLDEGILWVATPDGLASADVRINDWRIYDDIQGSIEGLEFDDDYVYVGGDYGMMRFDKYIETWELIDTLPVKDMVMTNEYLWCIRDKGIVRYDPAYEKFEAIARAPDESFHFIIETSNYLWFISQDTIVRFNKGSEAWSLYPGRSICDYETVGDSVFVVSNDSLFLYDPQVDTWTNYRDITGFPPVHGIGIYKGKILYAATKGLFVYDWYDRSRMSYTQTSGMEVDSLVDAYEDAQYRYVISNSEIGYLNKDREIWEIETIEQVGHYQARLFYLDEAGGHARIVPDIDIRVQGRAYYNTTYWLDDTISSTDYENINMRLIGQHESKRLLSMYYDDTDKEQTIYGFGYRGLDQDLFYQGDGGYLVSEYYEFDILPQFSTLGGHAKLRYHDHAVNLQGGYLKSKVRKDFYQGMEFSKEGYLFDVDYQKNTFYMIHVPPRSINPDFDTVFVDDHQSSTNTIGTRIGYSIAGIIGDFDVLINGRDYVIDYSNGFIHFFSPMADTTTVVLQLNEQEIVLQSAAIHDHERENIYFLGPDIVPGSCSLWITDTLGEVYPIDTWGLDNDGDGKVDPPYINHDLGYLMFPQGRPFPDIVYDDTLHIYTINYTIRTTSVFYYLSYKPILFGSEKVLVDGEILSRGEHYVLDYTSGILLFLEEDVVTDFSEIEVVYSSVERARSDVFFSTQPVIRFNEHVAIAPGYTQMVDARIMHLSGKVEMGTDETISVKFTPQSAITTDTTWAHNHSLITRYRFASLLANYKSFDRRFEGFGVREKKYGNLETQGTINANIELHDYITLDGQYIHEQQRDSLDREYTIQHQYAEVNYLNPRLPAWSILFGQDFLPDYDRDRITARLNYDFSLLKTQIKMYATVTGARLKFIDKEDERRVFEYIVNSGFTLPVPINGNIYLRHNDLNADRERQKQIKELRASLNLDVIPGLYYAGNYLLESKQYYLSDQQDVALHCYHYNNLNIAPGRWYTPLSIVNLACGTGKTFDEYIRNLNVSYYIPPLLLSVLKAGDLSSLAMVNSYYGLVQLIPWANVLLWNKYSVSASGQAYYDIPRLNNTIHNMFRFEYEPAAIGLFTLLWDFRRIARYPMITINNYYGEWRRPWTASLQTKISTNYRLEQDNYKIAYAEDTELRSNLETLFRLNSKSYITINLGGSRQEHYPQNINYLFTPGAGINVDLLKFLYLQCEYNMTHVLDSTTTHQVSAKITGKF